jgi:uncharacterized protein
MTSITPATPALGAGDQTTPARIFSLDVLRGIALLGILVISIWEFGGFSTNQQAFYRTGTHGGNYYLLSSVSMLFEGKMRALLSIIFGAGIILYITRRDHNSATPTYPDLHIRRMMWLMLFGLINAFILLWPGDILFHYGAMGILLFPFWRMPAKGLFIAALVTTLIYCGKTYWNYTDDQKAYKKFLAVTAVEKKFVTADSNAKRKIDSMLQISKHDPLSSRFADDTLLKRFYNDTLTRKQKKEKQAWEGLAKGLKYDSTGDDGDRKSMRSGSYTKTWSYLVGKSQFKESYWLYQKGIWDIGSMMFLGMALLGFGFFADRFPTRRYWMIALPCLLLGLLLAWGRIHFQNLTITDYAKYIDGHPVPYNILFPVERFLLALGYAGLLLAVLRITKHNWIWKSLAAIGQMALTNYFLQTIFCTLFFYGYGMGYFGRLNQVQLYFFVAETWLLQLLFSVLWLRFFTMGPAEWLWRSLVAKKRLPFKKEITRSQPSPTIY